MCQAAQRQDAARLGTGLQRPGVTTAGQIVIAAEVIDEALEGLRGERERP
jgi:hypothetical protein